MRVDATEFRRRLVRVVAGYPAAIAMAAVAYTSGWMDAGFALSWSIVLFLALVYRTR
jgi:hypothetical protein